MKRLDPTLDLVFRLLFTREPALLRDMVESIIARPIQSLAILDREIPGDLSSKKQIVLDIRARLDDGSRADVEMQKRNLPGLDSRLVFYVPATTSTSSTEATTTTCSRRPLGSYGSPSLYFRPSIACTPPSNCAIATLIFSSATSSPCTCFSSRPCVRPRHPAMMLGYSGGPAFSSRRTTPSSSSSPPRTRS